MTYEETKRQAAEDVGKLFDENRRRFRRKARLILKRFNAHERDQSLFSPITYCVGEPVWVNNSMGRKLATLKKSEALLTYYAGLIILHDTFAKRGDRITEGIWSENIWALALSTFNPEFADHDEKTKFIKKALKEVKTDLKRKRRPSDQLNKHIKKAYKHFRYDYTTPAPLLATWLNSEYGHKYRHVSPDNIRHTSEWGKHRADRE